MDKQTEDNILETLIEIRNWIRLASHDPVKRLLEAALPDEKSRSAYQMLDGSATAEQVRVACKMSPNALVAAANKWTALGIMSLTQDKKRIRLFDLNAFGLMETRDTSRSGEKS